MISLSPLVPLPLTPFFRAWPLQIPPISYASFLDGIPLTIKRLYFFVAILVMMLAGLARIKSREPAWSFFFFCFVASALSLPYSPRKFSLSISDFRRRTDGSASAVFRGDLQAVLAPPQSLLPRPHYDERKTDISCYAFLFGLPFPLSIRECGPFAAIARCPPLVHLTSEPSPF